MIRHRRLVFVWLLLCGLVGATITPGTNPSDGNGCSESTGTYISLAVQNAVPGGFVAILVGGLDAWNVTSATWTSGSGGLATLTVDTNPSNFTLSAGETIRVSGINPRGYDGDFRIVSATTTSVTYALAKNPGTFVSGGSVGTVVSSITDNATSQNTYVEVRGSYVASGTNGGGTDIWYVSSVILNAGGGLNMTVTFSGNGQGNQAGCVMEFMGLEQTQALVLDQAAGNIINQNVTTLITPSIGGHAAPELFVAVSACNGFDNGTTKENGIIFVPINLAGQGINGCPAAYYIAPSYGSSTQLYAAGLAQTPAAPGVTGIASFRGAIGN